MGASSKGIQGLQTYFQIHLSCRTKSQINSKLLKWFNTITTGTHTQIKGLTSDL